MCSLAMTGSSVHPYYNRGWPAEVPGTGPLSAMGQMGCDPFFILFRMEPAT